MHVRPKMKSFVSLFVTQDLYVAQDLYVIWGPRVGLFVRRKKRAEENATYVHLYVQILSVQIRHTSQNEKFCRGGTTGV